MMFPRATSRQARFGFEAGTALSFAIVAMIAGSGWTGLLWAGSGKTVAVRGRVTDASGAPVPGHSVRLLKSRTIVNLGTFQKQGQNVEEVSAATNAHGFFEFNFPIDKKFRYYYLRFYDPNDFDIIKYRLPADRDISRRARKGRAVQIDVVLDLQENWPEVEALVREYGAGTQRAQILRALGLPTRRTSEGPGRELWEYDEAAVSYLIEDGRVLETRRDRTGEAREPAGDAVPASSGGAGAGMAGYR